MASSGSFFPFLDKDVHLKLSSLIKYYFSVGQWEAAKWTLRQIDKRGGRAKDMVLDLVGSNFATSKSVPSVAFMQWLCFVEYKRLGGREEDFGARLVEQAVFEMALHSCKELASKDQSRVLEKLKELGKVAFSSRSAGVGGGGKLEVLKKMSPSDVVRVREVLALFPLLGNQLIAPFHGLRQLYVDIVMDLLTKNHWREALSFLPLLQAATLSSQEMRSLDLMLEQLLIATVKNNNNNNNNNNKNNSVFFVYQSLLGAAEKDCEVLVERFGALEDAAVKLDYRERVPKVFQIADRSSFWKALHIMSLVSGKHFFEILMEKCFACASEGRYGECAQLLFHFPEIRPLVLLIVGKRLQGSFDGQKQLVESLVLEQEADATPLRLHANALVWRVKAAEWCSQQACLKLTAERALQLLEVDGKALVDVVGRNMSQVDRKGLLNLLEGHNRDLLTCRAFFAVSDCWLMAEVLSDELVEGVAQTIAAIGGQDGTLVCVQCLKILYASLADLKRWKKQPVTSSSDESHFAIERPNCFLQIVNAVSSGYEKSCAKDSQVDAIIVEARFRLKCASSLENDEALFKSRQQLLSDAVMAEQWNLCREIVAFFALSEQDCPAVSFFIKEEEVASLRDACLSSQDAVGDSVDDALALADVAFSMPDARRSHSILRAALAVPSSDVVTHVLNRVLVVAEAQNIPVDQVFFVARSFPDELSSLKSFVESENRIRNVTSSVWVNRNECSREDVEKSLHELNGLFDGMKFSSETVLSRFLKYVLYLDEVARAWRSEKSCFAWLEEKPESFVSWLVSSGNVEAASKLCDHLGVSVVDALLARSEPITLPELQVIAQSRPDLAANLALQRHTRDRYQVALIDFAQQSFHNGSLDATISLCRHFASAFKVQDNEAMTETQAQVWSLLLDCKPLDFANEIVWQLTRTGRLDDALSVADEFLPSGPDDALLVALARCGGSRCWRYVTRIKDRREGAKVALAHFHELDLEHALDVLEMASLCGDSAFEVLAAGKLKLLRAYEPVLRQRNVFGPWSTWQELDKACQDNCSAVIRQLLEWKQFDLAKTISQCFEGDPQTPGNSNVSSLDIDADALLHLLEHGSDVDSLVAFLETLKDPISTSRAVLKVCKAPESRVILWEYLVGKCSLSHSTTSVAQMSKYALGAKVLSLLPSSFGDDEGPRMSNARRGLKFNDEESSTPPSSGNIVLPPRRANLRQALAHLEGHASCMIEVLVMNEKVSELKTVFHEIPQLVDNDMLVLYAKKALAFDADAAESVSPPDTSVDGLRWTLSGTDEVSDMSLRRQHFYACAPSMNLSTALLDLCSSARVAARASLDVCSHLASLLSGSPTSQHLLLLNLIKQLLFYAKLHFTKQMSSGRPEDDDCGPMGRWFVEDGGGREAGVAVCQTLLERVDLLHDLHMEDCGIVCSMEDLADPRLARRLRDKLVAQDRMKLAASVATKCAIEVEPVWLAWGLRLLRLGDFDGAKEKLTKCIESTDRSASTNNLFDRHGMLGQILDILQGPGATVVSDANTLRDELLAMEDALKAGGGDADTFAFASTTSRPGKNVSAPLDQARYMQCVYYLSRIGSPVQLIRFWLSHHCLEDACRYVIMGGLPESLFISEILTHCLSYNCTRDLFTCLPRIDPKGTKKTPYLVQACKYLNEAHAFDLLLEFQDFMQDWTRAGLTCVKLFHIESTAAIRLDYLKMAEKYFSNALKDIQQSRVKRSTQALAIDETGLLASPSVATSATDDLTESEITKYFRKVVLQIAIMEFLQERNNIPADEELRKLSMFGSSKDRVAERLVFLAPGSSDLAFRIMQEFRLPQGEIYARGARELVLNKRKSDLASLLKAIKGTIDSDEWDCVILAVVKAYCEDLNDKSAGEKFIAKIFNVRSQMKAYRMVGLYKTAYILAAKSNDVEEVMEIRTAALAAGSKTVVALCNSFLAKSTTK